MLPVGCHKQFKKKLCQSSMMYRSSVSDYGKNGLFMMLLLMSRAYRCK